MNFFAHPMTIMTVEGHRCMNIFMRSVFSMFYGVITTILLLSGVAVAQNMPDTASPYLVHPGNEEMQHTLEVQQQQLEEQKQLLQDLQRQVQELDGSGKLKPGVNAETTPPASSDDTSRKSAHREAGLRGKAQPDDDWPGSFGVENLNTRFKIGGFAELNVIYDDGAIGSKGQFITSTIATGDATKTEGADGQTSFSVQPTRLWVETRTPITGRRLKTFLSIDMYGDALGLTPDPRLRQGYGEVARILFGGDLLAGQVWTAFSDLQAFPNTLDYEGPGSFLGTREAELRWTRGLADGLDLLLAVESPDGHIIQGADSLTNWPDGVVSLVWDHAAVHLMGSGLLRDLRASADNGPTETAVGWGVSGSGKVGIPLHTTKDNLTFSVTYGEGIGSNFNDQPSDAVLDVASSSLDVIPVFGYYVSYEHWWNSDFNSTVVYGALDADNRDAQSSDAFHESQYFSANLIWMPTERWLFGGEFLRGERKDKDGADGTVNRYMFSSRFNF